jgi:hypothetical protein
LPLFRAFFCRVPFMMPYEGAGCRSCDGVAATDFVSHHSPGSGTLGGIVLTRFVRAGGEDRLARSESHGEPQLEKSLANHRDLPAERHENADRRFALPKCRKRSREKQGGNW